MDALLYEVLLCEVGHREIIGTITNLLETVGTL